MKRYIQKAKVVSFDIYDTLIVRGCKYPQDIFKIIESFGYEHFAQKRILAEKEARKDTQKEDVTLDDIYNRLHYYDKGTIKLEEVRIETVISRNNKEIFDIYNYCISEGKDVIITSDMYLPIQTIIKVLEENGITEYLELFLSSKVGLRKKTGRLFKYILNKLNIPPAELLHIGDDHFSDYLVPMKLGIMSYEYHTSLKQCNLYQCTKYNTNALMKLRCTEDDVYFKIGYTNLGPLLYGFSAWLHKKIEKNHPDKIVFLSRDGKIMKQAFELIYGEDEKNLYLFGSRRSLIVPILWKNPNLESIQNIIHFHDRMKISELLERIGLDCYQCQEELNSAGYLGDSTIDIWQLTGDDNLKSFYESIKPQVIKQSREEYSYACNYWKKNLNGSTKISIVDIGWNGNMQNALINLLENQLEVDGYYIGVNPDTKYDFQMEGYLFDKNGDFKLKSRIENFSGLFESFFMTNHGSAKRYTADSVELLPYEYTLEEGKIVDEDKNIEKIQSGALQFIIDIKNIIGKNDIHISSDESVANLLNLGLYPSSLSCDLLGDFRFYNSGISYLARPKNNYFNLNEFKQTNWRIGYLKRCFKINFPYYKLVKAIKLFKKISK